MSDWPIASKIEMIYVSLNQEIPSSRVASESGV